MYLVIDTETTGLPKNWKAPFSDVDNWPRMIQIGWASFDEQTRPVDSRSFIIRPDGFKIPPDAVRVHGITTARAMAEGRPVKDVLQEFAAAAAGAAVVVAHNHNFDRGVIGAECVRHGAGDPFEGKIRVCTMVETTEFCGIPSLRGLKWPSLAELHRTLFGTDCKETHSAHADVLTCAKCFFELKRRGVL